MKQVQELVTRVNQFKKPLEERYPELLVDKPVHIAYMSPMYRKEGLYRMILPAMELVQHDQFNTIVTNVVPDECTRSIDDFNIKLHFEIIEWADYMVFPATTQNMLPLIKHIKTYNPFVKVCVDVSKVFHNLNDNNYSTVRFRRGNPRVFENNLRIADLVLFPDKASEDYYNKLLGNKMKATAIIPNLLSSYQFES